LTVALLKEDFSESDLPFKVDIIDWTSISDDLKKIIQKTYQIIQTSGELSGK
jgi:hypothetical protein